MQRITPGSLEGGVRAGWAVAVILVSGAALGGLTARRLAALGAQIEVLAGLNPALERVQAGQGRADMLVIDCDTVGGFAAGQAAFDRLARAKVRLPVLLVSSECAEQIFPNGRERPIQLRSPVSAVAMRIAFDLVFAPSCAAFDNEKGRSRGGAPFGV